MKYQDHPLIQTIDDVFGADECQAFIDLSHQHDYEIAQINVARGISEVRTEVRNNQRVIYDSHELAAQIFAQVQSHLPAVIGDWTLEGLNERFRFYLYEHGQTFKIHYDAPYQRDKWHQSLLTLLIYLNDGYEGGETIFYQQRGIDKIFVETPVATITPKQGQILLFEHRQLHEGAPVISGQKYVLRTDVMYHYQPLVMR